MARVLTAELVKNESREIMIKVARRYGDVKTAKQRLWQLAEEASKAGLPDTTLAGKNGALTLHAFATARLYHNGFLDRIFHANLPANHPGASALDASTVLWALSELVPHRLLPGKQVSAMFSALFAPAARPSATDISRGLSSLAKLALVYPEDLRAKTAFLDTVRLSILSALPPPKAASQPNIRTLVAIMASLVKLRVHRSHPPLREVLYTTVIPRVVSAVAPGKAEFGAKDAVAVLHALGSVEAAERAHLFSPFSRPPPPNPAFPAEAGASPAFALLRLALDTAAGRCEELDTVAVCTTLHATNRLHRAAALLSRAEGGTDDARSVAIYCKLLPLPFLTAGKGRNLGTGGAADPPHVLSRIDDALLARLLRLAVAGNAGYGKPGGGEGADGQHRAAKRAVQAWILRYFDRAVNAVVLRAGGLPAEAECAAVAAVLRYLRRQGNLASELLLDPRVVAAPVCAGEVVPRPLAARIVVACRDRIAALLPRADLQPLDVHRLVEGLSECGIRSQSLSSAVARAAARVRGSTTPHMAISLLVYLVGKRAVPTGEPVDSPGVSRDWSTRRQVNSPGVSSAAESRDLSTGQPVDSPHVSSDLSTGQPVDSPDVSSAVEQLVEFVLVHVERVADRDIRRLLAVVENLPFSPDDAMRVILKELNARKAAWLAPPSAPARPLPPGSNGSENPQGATGRAQVPDARPPLFVSPGTLVRAVVASGRTNVRSNVLLGYFLTEGFQTRLRGRCQPEAGVLDLTTGPLVSFCHFFARLAAEPRHVRVQALLEIVVRCVLARGRALAPAGVRSLLEAMHAAGMRDTHVLRAALQAFLSPGAPDQPPDRVHQILAAVDTLDTAAAP
ncbi:hypothetical protein DIPPA_20595 [Diplonema papillatum]|nr:hypothetical protein DIPPA_20595 [Diplonema papillatum]